jgi:RNA polymerase sigma-70 factor (ECF subfamily)
MARWLRSRRPDRFEALLEPVWPRLWSFALRLTRDTGQAEELLHASVARAITSLDQLQQDGAFHVWMSRVVFSTWSHERTRASTRYETVGLDNVVQLDRRQRGPEQEADHARLGRLLHAALDELPEEQRTAVWLVDVQGLSYTEAATVLEVARGTVCSRVARARLTLRAALEDVAVEQGVIR